MRKYTEDELLKMATLHFKPGQSLIATTDGQFFNDNSDGNVNAVNHCRDNKGVEIVKISVPKK
jgi:hypothetical protein